MIRLKTKLTLYNLLSRLVLAVLFLIFLPWIIERVNLRQVDFDLIQKREKFIDLISKVGIEPFIISDSTNAFGSYDILKEEFISLEKIDTPDDLNYIEVTSRLIEGDVIVYRVLNYSFIVDGQKYLLEVGRSLTSIQRARKNIDRILFIFLVAVIIITLATDLQYTRKILKPLGKITDKLKGISNPLTFDKTPVRTTTFDFASLDIALKELMIKINEAFQKEKEITVNISHELLTPVSVLRSKLENLLLSEEIDPDISVKIEESLKTLHRLQTLVNSLLLIARIESHQYLREDTFMVNEVLREIVEELKPIAEDKGVVLEENYGADHKLKGANRSLVFSMFYNVINNSVKNTTRGHEVNVISSVKQGIFSVTISDDGVGMTGPQMNNLFSRFKTRSGNESGGTGIGLAITKSIADFHSVEISVSSEPGKGTIFSFIFKENS
jgi:signal transduction histidine kinase